MGMSVGPAGGDVPPEMNTTPLIDVMLVLLIIFLINIPVQTHAVKLDLPQQTDQQPTEPPKPPVIHKVTIDFLDNIYFDGTLVDLNTLTGYFQQAAAQDDQPEFHVRPEAQTRFETVNKVLASAQRSGVTKIGFIGNEVYAN